VRVYSRQELTREAELIGNDFYCRSIIEVAEISLARLKPRNPISTVEWAEKNRKFRTPEGDAMVPYDRWQTPYNIAKMDALDDPNVELVVVVKPSRSGGTTVAENYLGRMIDFGPMGRVGWYLGTDESVKKYCESEVRNFFQDHPQLSKRIGSGKSDNNNTSKLISGHMVEWLSAKDDNFRNRQFVFGVMDEPDGWSKFSESPETQLSGRQKRIGTLRKGIILSHPDKGWKAGVAAAFKSSSRGIYIMRCPECLFFASAHSTNLWKDVPQFKLFYSRNHDIDFDKRLEMAEKTAGMLCPKCGSILSDEQRFKMVDEAGAEGWWMHRGQELHIERGILESPHPNKKRGFYDHGLMLKVSTAADLAKSFEEVMINFEQTKGTKVATKALREFMSKQLGEIFEGKASLIGLSADSLRQRTDLMADASHDKFEFRMGEAPERVRFITGFADVGHEQFDVMLRGWDLQRRSWIVRRWTIRQRRHADGTYHDLDLVNVQDDWSVLDDVIKTLIPIQHNPEWALPVACLFVDAGDGNTIYKAAEYVRSRLGIRWGAWPRIWCSKGFGGEKNPHLAPVPTELNKDSNGQRVEPPVKLQKMGVDGLKDDLLGNDDGFGYLSIEDGSPGQIYFPVDFPRRAFEEIFAEQKIEGKYERGGRPNETLDCLVGTEAARLLLTPDKEGRDWTPGKESSIWAQRISLIEPEEGGDPAVAGEVKPEKKKSIFERFDDLNG
jgi:phage terminase large subunit GpA-like protein